MITCKICNKECNVLSRHLFNSHKEITAKQYYDLHFKKENEGICPICNKETNFINITKGYRTYCSTRCTQLDPLTTKKKSDTYFKKTGFTHNMLNPDSAAMKNNSFKKPEFQEKLTEIRNNLPEEQKQARVDKIAQTCLEKYGVSNFFKSAEMKEKAKETKLEKYGDENYNNREKAKETFMKENPGYTHLSQLPSYKEHIRKLRRQITVNNILEEIKEKNHPIKLVEYCSDAQVKFKCFECDSEFEMQDQMFWIRTKSNKKICKVCNPYYQYPSNSICEQEVRSFIEEQGLKTWQKQIESIQCDVFIEHLKLGFEYNGLYWHSEVQPQRHRYYHLTKTEVFERNGIHLVHIWEDDWQQRKEIVKSRILNLLGKSTQIYARECEIKEVDGHQKTEFLEKNHIQGNCQSKVNVGLFFKNELVSIMTFGNYRKMIGYREHADNEYELLRFCNTLNHSVVGGAQRLFKYFVSTYNPIRIRSYADRSWSCSFKENVYEKLGFKKDVNEKGIWWTEPNYWYVDLKDANVRYSRMKFCLSNLKQEGFDTENKTEKEIMQERGFTRLFDSGSLKYVWTKEEC